VGILHTDLWQGTLVFCIVYRKCVGNLVAPVRYWAVDVMKMTLEKSISYICSWISGDFVLEWTEMCNSCRLMNAAFISAVVRHKITIHICDKTSFTYAGFSWYWKIFFSSVSLSYHKEGFYKSSSEVLTSSLPLSRELLPSTATLTKSSFLVDDGMKHHYWSKCLRLYLTRRHQERLCPVGRWFRRRTWCWLRT